MHDVRKVNDAVFRSIHIRCGNNCYHNNYVIVLASSDYEESAKFLSVSIPIKGRFWSIDNHAPAAAIKQVKTPNRKEITLSLPAISNSPATVAVASAAPQTQVCIAITTDRRPRQILTACA